MTSLELLIFSQRFGIHCAYHAAGLSIINFLKRISIFFNQNFFTLTVVTSACLDFGPTLVLDAWIVDVLLWDLTRAFVMNTMENVNVNLDFLGINVKYVQMDLNLYWMDALTVSITF